MLHILGFLGLFFWWSLGGSFRARFLGLSVEVSLVSIADGVFESMVKVSI